MKKSHNFLTISIEPIKNRKSFEATLTYNVVGSTISFDPDTRKIIGNGRIVGEVKGSNPYEVVKKALDGFLIKDQYEKEFSISGEPRDCVIHPKIDHISYDILEEYLPDLDNFNWRKIKMF